KIEFHIVVLEIVAPGGDFTTEYFYSTSVFANLIYGCFCLRFVFLVEFNDRYFGLRRKVAHLREAYVWLSYPAFNCIWLHSPGQYFAGFSCRKQAAYDEPAVLSEHTTVEKHQVCIRRGDLYQPFGIIRSEDKSAAGFE